MKKLPYHLLDLFTDRAFGGNPLTVFTDGRGISDAQVAITHAGEEISAVKVGGTCHYKGAGYLEMDA